MGTLRDHSKFIPFGNGISRRTFVTGAAATTAAAMLGVDLGSNLGEAFAQESRPPVAKPPAMSFQTALPSACPARMAARPGRARRRAECPASSWT